jgi:hypothetical protein
LLSDSNATQLPTTTVTTATTDNDGGAIGVTGGRLSLPSFPATAVETHGTTGRDRTGTIPRGRDRH